MAERERPRVALLSDFGSSDGYVGAMKGVILGVCPDAMLIDISHEIPPHDVRKGAWVLAQSLPFFPPGTCALCVVDPGVGSARRAIALEVGGYRLVGPDNGIFSLLIETLGGADLRVHEVEPGALTREEISTTFHGRDLFAPIVGHLAIGVAMDAIGPRCDALVPQNWPRASRGEGGVIEGEVWVVDRFGNLITNIPGAWLEGEAWWRLRFRGTATSVEGVVGHFAAVPPGETLLYIGSSGYLEVAISMGNARQRLGFDVGARLEITRIVGDG